MQNMYIGIVIGLKHIDGCGFIIKIAKGNNNG